MADKPSEQFDDLPTPKCTARTSTTIEKPRPRCVVIVNSQPRLGTSEHRRARSSSTLTCMPVSYQPRLSWSLKFFFRIIQYIGDTHNAHTLIPINTRTQTLPPRSIFEDCAGKLSRLTKSPQTSRCRREHRLPLKTQTPLIPEKFAPTGSQTQDLRCYRVFCNH
jgi:hypothetical protein